MTYKFYLLKNNVKDSLEAYTEYLSRYDKVYGLMPASIRVQYAQVTYKYRFINF